MCPFKEASDFVKGFYEERKNLRYIDVRKLSTSGVVRALKAVKGCGAEDIADALNVSYSLIRKICMKKQDDRVKGLEQDYRGSINDLFGYSNYMLDLYELDLITLVQVLKIFENMNSKEFADYLGIGYSTLSMLESKSNKCGMALIRGLNIAYNLPFEHLIPLMDIYNEDLAKSRFYL